MDFQVKQVSNLNRIFLDGACEFTPVKSAKVLKGERYSYQLAYKSDSRFTAKISVESELGNVVSVRSVGNVPSELPCYSDKAMFCERSMSGLFPDVLFPIDETLFIKPDKWFSVWVTVEIPKDAKAGSYPITVKFHSEEGEISSNTFNITVIDAVLPEQTLISTQWFHSDCIADYFKVPVFSEEHWELIRKYMETFVRCGNTMILTPVFTPPLDTKVGGERTTVQLIDVKKDGDKYTFNFDKFRRWVKLAIDCGIRYFEISHLFSQWGAFAAPKVMAEVDGETKRIFGWETEAAGEEYSAFLHAFLPELITVIKELNIEEKTYFHISDEPNSEQIELYKKAKEVVADILKDFPIIDALSDYEFYENGIITQPIPSTSSIDEFIKKGFDNRWTYYCCGQGEDLSNRFFGMPLSATKIIGTQLYLHDIKGFLQWGFNFYNSAHSLRHINPYEVTDADCAFPSGDAFTVYPYDDGAIMSVRGEVLFEAFQEMRALQLLESIVGKDAVKTKLLRRFGIIKFRTYPRGTEKMIALRNYILKQIEKSL